MRSGSELVADVTPFGPVNVGSTERMVTAGLGGALLLAGLSRGHASGTAIGLLGGVMLLRAVTGHCPAYRALRGEGSREPARLPPPEHFGRRSAPGRARSDAVAEVLGGPHPDTTGRGASPSARPPEDEVTRDSEYSFPASDPPGWRDDER